MCWSPESPLKVPWRSRTLGPLGDLQGTFPGRRVPAGWLQWDSIPQSLHLEKNTQPFKYRYQLHIDWLANLWKLTTLIDLFWLDTTIWKIVNSMLTTISTLKNFGQVKNKCSNKGRKCRKIFGWRRTFRSGTTFGNWKSF